MFRFTWPESPPIPHPRSATRPKAQEPGQLFSHPLCILASALRTGFVCFLRAGKDVKERNLRRLIEPLAWLGFGRIVRGVDIDLNANEDGLRSAGEGSEKEASYLFALYLDNALKIHPLG